jgi:hypothetical protein
MPPSDFKEAAIAFQRRTMVPQIVNLTVPELTSVERIS